MTDLQAIQERHSVRAYKDKPIESGKLKKLRESIDRLNGQHDLHMQLIEDTRGVFAGIASKLSGWTDVPAYIAMIGRRRDDLEEICGYAGEQLVLQAQKLGLNTCWAGFFKSKKVKAEIGGDEKIVIVIAVGYGEDSGSPHRSKKIEDVTDVKEMPIWFKEGLDAALLAPTALNQQKFFFTLEGYEPKAKVSAKGPFVKLDLGIVKYHFEVGSGRKVL